MSIGEKVRQLRYLSDIEIAQRCKMKPIAEIIVASTYDGAPVKASDLKAQGAMAMFLKDDELDRIDMAALEAGIPNLEKHVENMLSFGVLGT